MDLYSILLAKMTGTGGGSELPETTNLLKGDGEGGAEAAVPGTDYATPAQVDAKYTKPDSGIPASDLASGVLPSFSTDPDQNVYEINGKYIAARYDSNVDEIVSKYATKAEMNAKYTKPSGGIPASDLASGVIPETSVSIGAASTDEEIPTAKAVYDAVSQKQDKPTLVTSGTAITLADNTEYVLSDVGSLTLSYPDGRFSSWLRITTAASGAISITLPTSRYLGAAPTFSNGETWEISVKDGVIVAGKVGSGS